MDRFQELSIFIAVSEEEGFAAAARRLRMSPPPVTRAITSLEERLGVKLLTRTTRHVRLTDAGERYLRDARQILADLTAADDSASGTDSTPSGELALTAPVSFGKLHVMPGVVEYLQQYPLTRVSVALLDRVVNLLEEGFDAGIRIGELPDSSMRAVRLCTVRSIVVASPDYLKKHGKPKKPNQLNNHTIVTTALANLTSQWRFEQDGKSIPLKVKPRLSVTNVDGTIAAVSSGFGVTRLLSYQVEKQLT